MSDVALLLDELQRRGVKLWAEDGRLRYRAPHGALTSDVLGRMKQLKPQLLTRLDAGPDPGSDAVPPRPQGPIPLSFAQQRLWFLHEMHGPNPGYNIIIPQRLFGHLDAEALRRALQQVVARYEILRTRFVTTDGNPVQVVDPPRDVALPVADVTALSADERHEEVARCIQDAVGHSFDLRDRHLWFVSLIRLSDEEHVLILCMHHIIADGWTLGLLMNDLAAVYAAERNAQPLSLAPPPAQYADYALWQRQQLSDGTALAWWKRYLSGAPSLLELPCDRPRAAAGSWRGSSVPFSIDAELTGRLEQVAREHRATLFAVVLAAFKLLLHRYTGAGDLVVGTQVAGRSRRQWESVAGFFVNTIPVRSRLSGSPTFSDWVHHVSDQALDAIAHQDVPFEKLVEVINPPRQLNYQPLVQVMLLWQNTPASTVTLPGLRLEPIPFQRATSKFDLTAEIVRTESGLDGILEFSTDLFDEDRIRRMGGHLTRLLEQIASNPNRPVTELSILTDVEREQVLNQWSGRNGHASGSGGSPQSIAEAFADRAREQPDAPAVIDGTNQTLTFGELNRRSDALANWLRHRGLRANQLVGLCLPSSADFVVAMLGVLKAGGAYLPLNPDWPAARRDRICADAGPLCVLDRLPDLAPAANINEAVNPTRIAPQSLAYAIYTSGSTGSPKGVMIEQASVINLVRGLEESVYSRLTRQHPLNVALMAPTVFDASVQQLFAALLLGHTLHIPARPVRRDPEALLDFFEERRIDLTDCTPSLLSMLLKAGLGDRSRLCFSHLLVGGEPLPQELVDRLNRSEADRDIAVTNVYGPTECCVDSTSFDVIQAEESTQIADATVSIGRPLPGARVVVLDIHDQPVPVGVPGELCIGGKCLGRGYLNQPGLTARQFVPDPFSNDPGQRLYRTGDRVCWTAAGTLRFIGRIDDQVKIRGFRIEPGEIEHHLQQHPAVRQAVAGVRGADDSRRLLAWIVADGSPTEAELRDALARHLPDYMLPDRFLRMAELPLNGSGKIDRRALPEPEDAGGLATGASRTGPRNDVEAAIVQVWEQVLQRSPISVRDVWFTLGGDSIRALQVVARLREAGYELTVRDLFERPTIEQLAPRLQRADSDTASSSNVWATNDTDDSSGPVPLSPIQRRFLTEWSGRHEHFNQSVLLECAERIEIDALQQSLIALHDEHQAFGFSYSRSDNQWVQTINPGVSARLLDVVDVADAEQLTRHAAEVQRQFRFDEPPLFRSVLYRAPDGDRLLLVAHHLIMDGVSWRVVLDDLQRTYDGIRRGASAENPPHSARYQDWTRQLERIADSLTADEPSYWHEVEHTAVPLTLPIDTPQGSRRNVDAGIVSRELNRDTTQRLLGECHAAYGTQGHELLLTGLLLAWKQWADQDAVTVLLESHGRHASVGLDVSRTVGWFTSVYPVVLTTSGDADRGGIIKRVKETLRAVPNDGLGYGLSRYHRRDAELTLEPAVAFNYLGVFDAAAPDGERAQTTWTRSAIDTGPNADPDATMPHEVEVLAMAVDGRLEIRLNYSAARFSESTMQRLLAAYVDELEAIVACTSGRQAPELTPSDIDYDGFNIEQLDAFLDGLEQQE